MRFGRRWLGLRLWNYRSIVLRDNDIWIVVRSLRRRTLRTIATWSAIGIHRQTGGIDHCTCLAWNGWQVVARIVPATINNDLKVHVATRGVTRGPREGNKFALLNYLADLRDQLRVVAITGLYVETMINTHAHARVAMPSGNRHGSIFTGIYR